jgi:cell division protein ZapE
MESPSQPPALREGRIIVPGSSRQLAAYGLFHPQPDRHRALPSGSRTFDAKALEPDLLWFSFDELCAPGTSAEDYSVLAAGPELCVIDGVPAPEPADAGSWAEAWEQFAAVLAVLAARNATLFVVGTGPMDWAAAASGAADARLRASLAGIDRLLAGLGRVESDEAIAVEGVSGS